MDIIDTASEVEELQRNAALAAHRMNRDAPAACAAGPGELIKTENGPERATGENDEQSY